MPDIPVLNCCGCTACFNACPSSAIKMAPNGEGFDFPVIDGSLCIGCGLCEKVCPINNPPALYNEFVGGFIAQNEKQDVLLQSTSGGFIDALCECVLSDGSSTVFGVAFDNNFLPNHVAADSYEKAKAFRNSKYAQSNLGNTFSEIKGLLLNGKKVLFIGTPCQVGGLKAFLGKEYENLITVDLVCRSVPSPKLWRQYLDWQEKRYNSKIKSVSCRQKTYGYHSGTLEICFENGKKYRGSNRIDYYMKAFHSNKCSRLSCYDCGFKTKHRCSDFTVFDSWQPEKVSIDKLNDNDKGFSNVIVHSQKGMEVLKNINNIVLYKADVGKMFDFTGSMESTSITYMPERDVFYKDVENIGFEKGVKKHIKVTLKDKLIEAAKPLRYGLKKYKK